MKRPNADDATCSRKTQHIATEPTLQSMPFDVMVAISSWLPITDVHRMGLTCRSLLEQVDAISRAEGGLDVLISMMTRAPTIRSQSYCAQRQIDNIYGRHNDAVYATLLKMPNAKMQALVARLPAHLLHVIWTLADCIAGTDDHLIRSVVRSPVFTQLHLSERDWAFPHKRLYRISCASIFAPNHVRFLPDIARVAPSALPEQWNLDEWCENITECILDDDRTDETEIRAYVDAMHVVLRTDLHPPRGTFAIVASLFVFLQSRFSQDTASLMWEKIVVHAARRGQICWNPRSVTSYLDSVCEHADGCVLIAWLRLTNSAEKRESLNAKWFATLDGLREVWNTVRELS